MKSILFKTCMLLFLSMGLSSCQKFLEAKPDKKLVVPASLQDAQALLDRYQNVNYNIPNALEASADDYYLPDATWAALTVEEDRRLYTWEKDRLFKASSNDWSVAYQPVYRANTVLETLENIPKEASNQAEWNNLKGQALVIRSLQFLSIALVWSQAFDDETAASDLGIPIRLGTDFNQVSVRGSVNEGYQQVIADLKTAVPLLPVTPVSVLRPSKPAAYALLARTYLAMRKYAQAGLYADSCLKLNNTLMDYNLMNANAPFPFTRFNKEVIMENLISGARVVTDPNYSRIVSSLYSTYAANDLRKQLFFAANKDGSQSYKGSYVGDGSLFGGVATDEVYLMRAECAARQGKLTQALGDLNELLVKRWKTGTFTPVTAQSPAEALAVILMERRKELLLRGIRWMDVKRLNKEGAGINLTRNLNGKLYTLPANDLRFALPIPEDIILLTGMPQNPR